MYNMTIQLQTNSEKCLYEQIYEHIKKEIHEGKLLAGERLPSTRSLAENLQIARSTVEYAYDQLLSEGYIESRPYKGYFVCSIEGLYVGTDSKQSKVEYGEEKVPDMKKGQEGEDSCLDFSPNAIDMSAFPFSVWKKITKNILTDSNQELFSQGDIRGDEDLRTTIGRYLYDSRGVNCSPEQIVIGAGNDYLLMLLGRILGNEITVAMENPTYKKASRIFSAMGYQVCPMEMDESGMRMDLLQKSSANLAYVMPSHQFPTGIRMPIKRRTELLNWAAQKPGRYLLEDDYDSEFRYHGKPIPALQSGDYLGRVIYIGTFSKAIAPAIRVSFMVLPKELLTSFYENCSFYSCTVSRIDQRILNEFIKGGYFERHLNKMRKIYKAKHDCLVTSLTPFEEKFSISGENAGSHVVLTAKEEVSEQALIEKAKNVHVKVYSESEYLISRQKRKPSVLLGFGGLSEDQITQGVLALQKAWLE